MEKYLIKQTVTEMDQLKLFKMIQDLSEVHFAKIKQRDNNEVTVITFYTRIEGELVCRWNFDSYFFNKELKDLFNKHNSISAEVGGKEQKK